MQYFSPITKDNDIVNKNYVDKSISAVNSEIEKVNTNLEAKVESLQNEVNLISETVEDKADNEDIENIQAQLGNLTDLETTSKDNLVGAINEVMSNIPDLSEVTSQIGTLANLTTEDKTNLVNAINEVASKGGVEMSSTVLYEGAIGTSSKSVTLTDNVENYDIVVVTLNNMAETISNYSSRQYFYDCGNFVLFPNIINTFSQNKVVKSGTATAVAQRMIQGNIVGNKLTVIGAYAEGTSNTKGWETSDVKVIGIKLGG